MENKYITFDREKRLIEKRQFTYLTNVEFGIVKQGSLIELTEVLIKYNKPGYKIDIDYQDEIIKLIDGLEPKYITNKQYALLVMDTPYDNLKRFCKKYNNIDFFIRQSWLDWIELRMMEIKRKESDENK